MFESLLGSAFGGLLDTGISGGISSALGGLLGGKSKGPSIGKQMKMQYDYQLQGMFDAPRHQVAGLRAAGLNPILAATHGPATTQQVTASGTDDRVVGLQAASARAQIANQAAQAMLYKAQADKTVAETETEQHRPMNVAADTGVKMGQRPLLEAQTRQSLAAGDLAGATKDLQVQLTKTEDWKTRTATVETFMKNFEYELALKNLPPRQAAEIKKLSAEARSATTEAELNESLRQLERVAGIAGQAVGSARALKGLFQGVRK